MKSIGTRRWLLVLLPLLLLSRCTCNPESVNRGDLNVVPTSEEWQMGEQLAAQVAQQVRFVDDPVLRDYVESLGERIVEQKVVTDTQTRPWVWVFKGN